jgi:5-methylcytosine-specific restriction endonuclease McrA
VGKLKGRGLKPRLTPMKPRLAPMKDRPGEDASRRSKDWLNTSRWQALRRQVLARDGFTCQQTGEPLIGRYPAWNSPVVDHIEPHRGDPELFWDADNLQSVSKEWHDRTKQSMEKRGLA